MDARGRFGSLLEWVCAAICAASGALLLLIAVHSFERVPALVPVLAKEGPAPGPINGIPAGVARVPLLLLENDRKVQVGERLGDVTARLAPDAQLVSESREDLGGRIRATRFYTDVGTQFILVFDAARRDQDLRVSAIFIR